MQCTKKGGGRHQATPKNLWENCMETPFVDSIVHATTMTEAPDLFNTELSNDQWPQQGN